MPPVGVHRHQVESKSRRTGPSSSASTSATARGCHRRSRGRAPARPTRSRPGLPSVDSQISKNSSRSWPLSSSASAMKSAVMTLPPAFSSYRSAGSRRRPHRPPSPEEPEASSRRGRRPAWKSSSGPLRLSGAETRGPGRPPLRSAGSRRARRTRPERSARRCARSRSTSTRSRSPRSARCPPVVDLTEFRTTGDLVDEGRDRGHLPVVRLRL